MPPIEELIRQGGASAWLFFPTALLLGALHGLEPGHSKTMMAAFIIAVRGTVGQAILLGLSAAFSHSLIIWLLAAAALHFGPQWTAESTEPYLQIFSGILILGMAGWMFWRTRQDSLACEAHEHGHHHEHEDESGHHHHEGDEHDHHDCCHHNPSSQKSEPTVEFQDAHERAHAEDIARRFKSQTVTTWQIVLFGLTGGLLPCPAALTILLVCLQLKQFTLGFTLVMGFSIGLAVTLVAVGATAAWGAQHASKRFSGWSKYARKAPYLSSGILLLLGLYICFQGWRHLNIGHL